MTCAGLAGQPEKPCIDFLTSGRLMRFCRLQCAIPSRKLTQNGQHAKGGLSRTPHSGETVKHPPLFRIAAALGPRRLQLWDALYAINPLLCRTCCARKANLSTWISAIPTRQMACCLAIVCILRPVSRRLADPVLNKACALLASLLPKGDCSGMS